jgi:hypothetical protein
MTLRSARKPQPPKPAKAKKRPQLQVVGPNYVEAAPLPPRRQRKIRAAVAVEVEVKADCCPHCGGTIGRMDFEVHARSGRCGPCDEALTE